MKLWCYFVILGVLARTIFSSPMTFDLKSSSSQVVQDMFQLIYLHGKAGHIESLFLIAADFVLQHVLTQL